MVGVDEMVVVLNRLTLIAAMRQRSLKVEATNHENGQPKARSQIRESSTVAEHGLR